MRAALVASAALFAYLVFLASDKPEPTPVVRVTAAVAMEMCGRIEFVVVTKSNGDSTLVLDPSREAIELLDKTIADPNRKQAVHFKCPSSVIL